MNDPNQMDRRDATEYRMHDDGDEQRFRPNAGQAQQDTQEEDLREVDRRVLDMDDRPRQSHQQDGSHVAQSGVPEAFQHETAKDNLLDERSEQVNGHEQKRP